MNDNHIMLEDFFELTDDVKNIDLIRRISEHIPQCEECRKACDTFLGFIGETFEKDYMPLLAKATATTSLADTVKDKIILVFRRIGDTLECISSMGFDFRYDVVFSRSDSVESVLTNKLVDNENGMSATLNSRRNTVDLKLNKSKLHIDQITAKINEDSTTPTMTEKGDDSVFTIQNIPEDTDITVELTFK